MYVFLVLFQRPKAIMPFVVGQEEEGFLKSLAPLELKDLEPKASNCTEVIIDQILQQY